MNKKHFLAIGIVLATSLLLIATAIYPGGSSHDAHATGFDWRYNYISNLFVSHAINGAVNTAQPWAICGSCCWCLCIGYFFFEFSARIPQKGSAAIIRYSGLVGAVAAALAATPLHDITLMIASTALLVGMFYILIFVFRAGLLGLGLLSAFTMLVCYFTNYVYFTQQLLIVLPPLQKFGLVVQAVWMLCLYYRAPAAAFVAKETAG